MKKIHVKMSLKSKAEGGELMEQRKFSLKELRARKKETQEEAAAALGVSPQTYLAWEKNISNVAIGKVLKVAEHFGVDLVEIEI